MQQSAHLIQRRAVASECGDRAYDTICSRVACTYALCQVFSGRAAFLHVGAIIATIMSANVLMVIIPGQRKVVAQMRAGAPVSPEYGRRGKQRSVHNNYLTLPVVFAMLSNHYAFTYSHPNSWLLMALVLACGVLLRLYFNQKHKGQNWWSLWLIALALALLGAWLVAPSQPKARVISTNNIASRGLSVSQYATKTVAFKDIANIVEQRCAVCHAAAPSYPGIAAAPKGVLLQTEDQTRQHGKAVYDQTVRLRAMPMGNITNLTEAERGLIGAWFEGGMR